jgi:hypothetical protein
LLLPLGDGIGFLLHEQLRHHPDVAVHRNNPPDTLWAVGAEGDAREDSRFSNTRVRDDEGVGVGYNNGF